MARVNYTGIVDNITGRMNGSVFQRNGSGNIIRSRGHVKRNNTSAQQLQQSSLQYYMNKFNGCTIAQKIAWNDYAILHPRTNIYGRTLKLNGINYFVSVNQTRVLCSNSGILSPVAYILPNAIPTLTGTFTTSLLKLDFSSAGLTTDDFMKVYTTGILTNGSSSFKRYLLYEQVVAMNGLSTINLRDTWQSIHNINLDTYSYPVNCCIGIRVVMCSYAYGTQSVPIDFLIVKT